MAAPISFPTARDRDLGLVLLFLSLVFYFAVPPLAYEFGLSKGTVAAFSTPIGAILTIVGLAATFFARKKISFEDGLVKVKDGFFARPLNLRYEQTPTFKLTGFEEESNGRADEIWTVHMVEQGRQFLVDRRVGQQMSSRALAESLAKSVRGSLVESYEGKNYKFEVEELDLSFVERLDRYPELLGHKIPEPSDKVVHFDLTDSGLKVHWSLFRSGLLFELFCVSAFLVVAGFIPLPGGPDGQVFSLYDAEKAEGDYRYFIAVGLFTIVSLVVLAGYRNTLELVLPKRVQSRTTVWGVPVRGARISLEDLEHVGVSVTTRGPYLQLISDRKIIRQRMPANNIAQWLAWEFKSRLGGLSPDVCENVEQSVEMQSY